MLSEANAGGTSTSTSRREAAALGSTRASRVDVGALADMGSGLLRPKKESSFRRGRRNQRARARALPNAGWLQRLIMVLRAGVLVGSSAIQAFQLVLPL